MWASEDRGYTVKEKRSDGSCEPRGIQDLFDQDLEFGVFILKGMGSHHDLIYISSQLYSRYN